jgi:hypothetical protein
MESKVSANSIRSRAIFAWFIRDEQLQRSDIFVESAALGRLPLLLRSCGRSFGEKDSNWGWGRGGRFFLLFPGRTFSEEVLQKQRRTPS